MFIPKKILTIGSCLSATIADELEKTAHFYRLSSVQHNRIDQFMENYVYKSNTPLKKSDLNLKIKSDFKNVNVFRNQFEEVELGKALPFNREKETLLHPIDAIEQGNIDLLIIDNYPDMFFKVYKHKVLNTKFFVNKSYLEEEPQVLEFINQLLDPVEAVRLYKDFINYCKSKNKNLEVIFIHFPINLKNKDILQSRENIFIEEINKLTEIIDKFHVISPWEIKISDLSNPNDPYHFTREKYKEYALECKNILMKRVLVTGGAGFIGSHIVEELLENNYDVIIIDNLSTGKFENVKDLNAKFFECDINSKAFQQIVDGEKPDFIIHQAAQVSVAESLKDVIKDEEINIKGSLNVLEAAKRNNVKKVIFASSAAVYGEPKYLPIKVEHPLSPLSPYGLSKLTVESYLKMYSNLYNLNFSILRYSNVYGPRQDAKGEGGVVSIFIDNIVKGSSPYLFGDGEQTRDFIYVKDIAKANVKALTLGNNEIMNVSSNSRISVNQLFETMKGLTASDIHPITKEERKGDIKHSQLSNIKTEEILGIRLNTSLTVGLKETISWARGK